MIFATLVLLTAFAIEAIGTYVSVLGLSALFASSPVIIALAVALDVGKLVTVSFLYKQWKRINWVMKTYMTVASIVLMLITSSGAFGYLSGAFQKAISGTNQDNIILQSLTAEQDRLSKRKVEIDGQIAKLPDNMVRGRTQLLRQFGPEVGRINKRIEEIEKQLPALKVASVKQNVEVGPIIYIAQAFNTDPEHAVKWVILTIIFVFDPLAVALLLAANFLFAQRKVEPVVELTTLAPTEEPLTPVPDLVAPPTGVSTIVADGRGVSMNTVSSTISLSPELQEMLKQFDPEKHDQGVVHHDEDEPPADLMQEAEPQQVNVLKVADQMEVDLGASVVEPLVQAEIATHASPILDEMAEDWDEQPVTLEPVKSLTHQGWVEELGLKPAREVITLDQVAPQAKPVEPVVPRSSLEDASSRSDVEIIPDSSSLIHNLVDHYSGDVISVGSPLGRR